MKPLDGCVESMTFIIIHFFTPPHYYFGSAVLFSACPCAAGWHAACRATPPRRRRATVAGPPRIPQPAAAETAFAKPSFETSVLLPRAAGPPAAPSINTPRHIFVVPTPTSRRPLFARASSHFLFFPCSTSPLPRPASADEQPKTLPAARRIGPRGFKRGCGGEAGRPGGEAAQRVRAGPVGEQPGETAGTWVYSRAPPAPAEEERSNRPWR